MGIPESQLDTWSHQGSVTQSSATYNTIKNALEPAGSPYAGKNYEVFYFSGTGKHLFGPIKDTLPWKELTPIVMVDRVVMGKDWQYLDSLSTAHKIPLHKRD